MSAPDTGRSAIRERDVTGETRRSVAAMPMGFGVNRLGSTLSRLGDRGLETQRVSASEVRLASATSGC